eukprot:GFUD01068484.1.p1 GENE.GFUD01068484.1~~GFUD01068484.1.p1  ORF type:complete len:127 (+),score=25.98 GFUD01068484.1:59-382(+)
MFCSIFFCSFLACISTTTGLQSSGELEPDDERHAFDVCNLDKVGELTWQKVEQCEEKFADVLVALNITLLSKVKFDAADLSCPVIIFNPCLGDCFQQWLRQAEGLNE